MGPLAGTLAVCVWTVACVQGTDTDRTPTPTQFTNMWLAEIHGGEGVAQRVARDLGYTYDGPAGPFKNHYVFLREDHPKVSTRDSGHLTRALTDLDEVKWAQQQKVVKRSKRGFVPQMEDESREPKRGNDPDIPESKGEPNVQSTVQSEVQELLKKMGLSNFQGSAASFEKCGASTEGLLACLKIPKNMLRFLLTGVQGDLTKLGTFSTKPVDKGNLGSYTGPTKHIESSSKKVSAYSLMFNDPLWKKQWYMQDYRTKDMPVMDHNIVPVYKMGYTGKGVYVAVVDDGVQGHHPDLVDNFEENLSYDFCHDSPGCEPDFKEWDTPSHGTQCAGVIAMKANNFYCGVGVAHNSIFGGLRVLCPMSVEYSEAKSLVHEVDTYDIYSNSWGPMDDGMTYEPIGHLTDLALNAAIQEGRDGKGTIYVFACGNGRKEYDNCAADSNTNHVATIGIAAAGQGGKPADYSERCTGVFATAYSLGDDKSEGVVSSYINSYCTTGFSGTSAATPIATGIIALVLEAKPQLTYRDVMHLIAWTAEVAPLADNENSWYRNGRGFWVSNDFGFGLLNAENMVLMAKDWKRVPEKRTCTITISPSKPLTIALLENAVIPFETSACQGTEDAVSYLEAIELIPKVVHPYRGAVAIKITSPEGTESDILEYRMNDDSNNGLADYNIKSVHNWGENPKGKWKLELKSNTLIGLRGATGYISEFTLKMHGTVEKPAHYDTPRTYAAFRLPDGKTADSKRANKAK